MSKVLLFEPSVTERSRFQEEIAKRVQLQVLRGAGFESTMAQLAKDIELVFPGFTCAIFLPSDDKQRLVLVTAPSISDTLRDMIAEVHVGPDSCPFGRTAYFGKPIFLSASGSGLGANQNQIEHKIVSAGVRIIYSTPVKTESDSIEAVFALLASTEISVTKTQINLLDYLAMPIRMAIHNSRAQKSLERERLAIETNRKLATLGEMASGIAHEINNPLAVINGSAEMIKEIMEQNANGKEIDPTSIQRYVEKILRNVDRVQRIMRSLKNYSRNSTFDPQTVVTLGALIDDVMELSHSRTCRADLNFNLGPGTSNTVINCRPGEIVQVLMNLVNNALDAVEGSESPWVTVDVHDRTDAIKITITDSGSGVPADIEPHLFDAFFTTKQVGKGTGLGLSISKKLINAHGGELYYNSRSKNTQFIVELPFNLAETN